jgi:hypothetical protein
VLNPGNAKEPDCPDKKQIITDQEYRKKQQECGRNAFRAAMGAEAVQGTAAGNRYRCDGRGTP